MADETGTTESFKDIVVSVAGSTGVWSLIAAIVGITAIVAGGIITLTIDELENFGITLLVIGAVLIALALVLSPRAVAMFLSGRQGRYGANVVVMTVAFFTIAVLVNFLLFRSPTRFDLTATNALTLAPQTIQILDTLTTDVRANAFFVDDRLCDGKRQALAGWDAEIKRALAPHKLAR